MWTDTADETLPEDVEAEGEPEVETLDDLEPEMLERVQRFAARQVDAERQKLEVAKAGLRQRGLDLSEDGSPVIRDLQTASGFFGAVAPPAVPPVARAAPEPSDEAPDIYTDPAAYNAWVDKRIEARAREIFGQQSQEFDERQKRQERITFERETEFALGRVGDALRTYSPPLADVIHHPDFETMFKEALSQVDVRSWNDPRTLAMVVGTLVPNMDLSKVRTQRPQPRDGTSGRYTPDRSAYAQVAPSRDMGRLSPPGRDPEMEAAVNEAMQRLGGTREEWESVARGNEKGYSIKDYRAAKQAAKQRR